MDTGSLFTLGRPCGEHGGVYGEGRLLEVVMFEGFLRRDPTFRVVC